MSHTSTAVKARYNAKTYKRYQIALRKEDDADLIAWLDAQTAAGRGVTDVIREALRAYLRDSSACQR